MRRFFPPFAGRLARRSTNLNIYLSDTLFTLSAAAGSPTEIHYGPFTSDSAADSPIKPRWMIGPWRVLLGKRSISTGIRAIHNAFQLFLRLASRLTMIDVFLRPSFRSFSCTPALSSIASVTHAIHLRPSSIPLLPRQFPR